MMKVSPLAGQLADPAHLVDIPKLVTAYYTLHPDPSIAGHRVAFGTSGHRGSSFNYSFNEDHIVAIAQAICLYRQQKNISGPLFVGIDTHALSIPAMASVVEVFAANGVETVLAEHDEYTPTPVISHAILAYNRGKHEGLADGVVITPSHNPPGDGGIKYNPPNGGPADETVTGAIERAANGFLEAKLAGVKRIPFSQALKNSTTRRYNYREAYIADLGSVIEMDKIRSSGIALGVDPLGGAGVHYWKAIAERYKLNLTVVNEQVDPTFRFMTLDWDGNIRMDPSSPYAMHSLISLKDKFDVSFSCDTDHDRHGIVAKSCGLLPTNHFLSTAIFYLFQHRPLWNASAGVGKTLVSSQMIDRVAASLQRKVFEVPVGFKWFVDGLFDGSYAFVGEESAGGSFARLDGSVWTTDKDGIILALLAAEITAVMKRDPGEVYQELTKKFGEPFFDRIDAAATPEQKARLKKLSPDEVHLTELAGEKVEAILNKAPANGAPIGGVKVIAKNGWFAARPSGTENIYKIYGESFISQEHLQKILGDAQKIVDQALA